MIGYNKLSASLSVINIDLFINNKNNVCTLLIALSQICFLKNFSCLKIEKIFLYIINSCFLFLYLVKLNILVHFKYF